MTKPIREHIPEYDNLKLIVAFNGSILFEGVADTVNDLIMNLSLEAETVQRQADKLKDATV